MGRTREGGWQGLNLLGDFKEAYLTSLKQTCLRRGVEASYADPV
jgi:hypothetical protein